MASLVSKRVIVLKPENVAQLVFFMRGEKVMFDVDLAMLYGGGSAQLESSGGPESQAVPGRFRVSIYRRRTRCFEITICDLKVPNFSGWFPFEITDCDL